MTRNLEEICDQLEETITRWLFSLYDYLKAPSESSIHDDKQTINSFKVELDSINPHHLDDTCLGYKLTESSVYNNIIPFYLKTLDWLLAIKTLKLKESSKVKGTQALDHVAKVQQAMKAVISDLEAIQHQDSDDYFNPWQYVLNQHASQQIMGFVLFYETMHHNGELSIETYKRWARDLCQVPTIKSELHQSIVYLAYCRAGVILDANNPNIQYDRCFKEWSQQTTYDLDQESRLSVLFCQARVEGQETPAYLSRFINHSLLTRCLYSVITRYTDKEIASQWLGYYLSAFDDFETQIPSADSIFMWFMGKITAYFALQMNVNFQHDPYSMRYFDFQQQIIQKVIYNYFFKNTWVGVQYLRSPMKSLLALVDCQLAKARSVMQQSTANLIDQNKPQSYLEPLIKHSILPVFSGVGFDLKGINELVEALLVANTDQKSVDDFLTHFNANDYKMRQARSADSSVLRELAPNMIEYWLDSLHIQLNQLIEYKPPESFTSNTYSEQSQAIFQLFNQVKKISQTMQMSIPVDEMIERYQNAIIQDLIEGDQLAEGESNVKVASSKSARRRRNKKKKKTLDKEGEKRNQMTESTVVASRASCASPVKQTQQSAVSQVATDNAKKTHSNTMPISAVAAGDSNIDIDTLTTQLDDLIQQFNNYTFGSLLNAFYDFVEKSADGLQQVEGMQSDLEQRLTDCKQSVVQTIQAHDQGYATLSPNNYESLKNYQYYLNQILPLFLKYWDFCYAILQFKDGLKSNSGQDYAASRSHITTLYQDGLKELLAIQADQNDRWHCLLGNNGFQVILTNLLMIERLAQDKSLSQDNLKQLTIALRQYNQGSSEEIGQVSYATDFFYYQQTGEILDPNNPFIRWHREFTGLLCQPEGFTYNQMVASVNNLDNLHDDSIQYMPGCLSNYLISYLQLYCADVVIQKYPKKEDSREVLIQLVNKIFIDNDLEYSSQIDKVIKHLLNNVTAYAAYFNDMDLFHNPCYFSDDEFLSKVIKHLVHYMMRNTSDIAIIDKELRDCLGAIDQAIYSLYQSIRQSQSPSYWEACAQSMRTIFSEELKPLLTIRKQNVSIIWRLADELNQVVYDNDKLDQFLSQFDSHQYKLPSTAVNNGGVCSDIIPYTLQYWAHDIQASLEALYENKPPKSCEKEQYLTAVCQLMSHISQLAGDLGISINIDSLSRPYSDALCSHFDNKKANNKAQTTNKQAKKGGSQSRRRRKNKGNGQLKPKLERHQQSADLDDSKNDAEDAKEQANCDSHKVGGDSHKVSGDSHKVGSDSHKVGAYDRTNNDTRLDQQTASASSDAKYDGEPQKQAVRSSIPDEELPQLLKDVANKLLLVGGREMKTILYGGAVTALCRQEHDKIRDYDCAVTTHIDEPQAALENMQSCLNSSAIAQDSQSSLQDATITLQASRKNPLLVIKDNTSIIEINPIRISDTYFETTFYNFVCQLDFMPSSLYINVSEPPRYDGYRPIRGVEGALKSLADNKIRAVVPKHGDLIRDRLIDNPVRFIRLTKLMLTFPDMKPNNGLVKAVSTCHENPQCSADLISQANQSKKQLGTAFEKGLFGKFGVEEVVKGLLNDQIPVIATLTGLPNEQLKNLSDIWIEHIKKAGEDDYQKKLYLFQCLLTASYALQTDKYASDCELAFFYDIRPYHLKYMNYISLAMRSVNDYGDMELLSDVHELIKQTQQRLQASNTSSCKERDTSTETSSESPLNIYDGQISNGERAVVEPSKTGYFADTDEPLTSSHKFAELSEGKQNQIR